MIYTLIRHRWRKGLPVFTSSCQMINTQIDKVTKPLQSIYLKITLPFSFSFGRIWKK